MRQGPCFKSLPASQPSILHPLRFVVSSAFRIPTSYFFLFPLPHSDFRLRQVPLLPSQKQCMLTVAGFPVGGHPDGPFAGYRALMLANTATDAALRIHIRFLKPYLDLKPVSRPRGRFKRGFVVYLQSPFPVADDSSPAPVRSGR
jgi:hypothetical protein